MEELTYQLIENFGFPVACVIGLAFFLYKIINQVMTQNKEREEKYLNMLTKYSEQMDKLEQANEDFVVVIGKLRDDVNEIKEVVKNEKKMDV